MLWTPTTRTAEVPPGLATIKRTRNDTPIVVDAGSWQFRAGYAVETMPSLVFDPTVHRFQQKQGEPAQFAVGRNGPAGATRTSSRTPFEAGVVVHFVSMEHILDHVFSRLRVSVDDGAVTHPILMTEPFANPPYCRREMSEMLFECYQVPRVAYGIDCLFSHHHNQDSSTALIISVGNSASHVVARVDGRISPDAVKRLNFGGAMAADLLLRLMQCKYPTFPTKMAPWQAQEVLHRAAKVALNYHGELRALATDRGLCDRDFVVQYPFAVDSTDPEDKAREHEALLQKRREQAQKLRERAERQKQEKLGARIHQLEALKKLVATSSNNVERIQVYGYETLDELLAAVALAERDLESYQNKLRGVEEPKEPPDYSLLEVPDAQLDDLQLKEKRRLRLLKNAADARDRLRREREEHLRLEEEKRAEMERLRLDSFEEWQSRLYGEREQLMARIKARAKRREALADRRSHASGARLKNVVSLADDAEEEKTAGSNKKRRSDKPKAQDTFGADDADWLIYREISREEEEDSSDDEARVGQIESQLEQHDPAFFAVLEQEMAQSASIWDKLRWGPDHASTVLAADPALVHQLHVNVERFRVPQVLFQPPIAGIDQAGLSEIIDDLLRRFDPAVQQTLAENIFVTGGFSAIEGLEGRLEADLTCVRPAGSAIRISSAKDRWLDAWKGAASLVRSDPDAIPWMDRAFYEEHGGERLVSSSWFTNPY